MTATNTKLKHPKGNNNTAENLASRHQNRQRQ
jgi:hypothetical protein